MRIKLETITTEENFCKYAKLSAMKQQRIYNEPTIKLHDPPSRTIVLSRNLSWHYHSGAAAEDECFVGMP